MEQELIIYFAVCSISSAFFMTITSNPIYSICYLVAVFVNASALYILLGIEYLAIIFIIVYVGAVSILFIFVIMMLNIPSSSSSASDTLSHPPHEVGGALPRKTSLRERQCIPHCVGKFLLGIFPHEVGGARGEGYSTWSTPLTGGAMGIDRNTDPPKGYFGGLRGRSSWEASSSPLIPTPPPSSRRGGPPDGARGPFGGSCPSTRNSNPPFGGVPKSLRAFRVGSPNKNSQREFFKGGSMPFEQKERLKTRFVPLATLVIWIWAQWPMITEACLPFWGEPPIFRGRTSEVLWQGFSPKSPFGGEYPPPHEVGGGLLPLRGGYLSLSERETLTYGEYGFSYGDWLGTQNVDWTTTAFTLPALKSFYLGGQPLGPEAPSKRRLQGLSRGPEGPLVRGARRAPLKWEGYPRRGPLWVVPLPPKRGRGSSPLREGVSPEGTPSGGYSIWSTPQGPLAPTETGNELRETLFRLDFLYRISVGDLRSPLRRIFSLNEFACRAITPQDPSPSPGGGASPHYVGASEEKTLKPRPTHPTKWVGRQLLSESDNAFPTAWGNSFWEFFEVRGTPHGVPPWQGGHWVLGGRGQKFPEGIFQGGNKCIPHCVGNSQREFFKGGKRNSQREFLKVQEPFREGLRSCFPLKGGLHISNIAGLGKCLYTVYWSSTLLASLILLVAMIGAILLSLADHSHHPSQIRQDLFSQISTHNTVLLFSK